MLLLSAAPCAGENNTEPNPTKAYGLSLIAPCALLSIVDELVAGMKEPPKKNWFTSLCSSIKSDLQLLLKSDFVKIKKLGRLQEIIPVWGEMALGCLDSWTEEDRKKFQEKMTRWDTTKSAMEGLSICFTSELIDEKNSKIFFEDRQDSSKDSQRS